jgi:phosphatidate cytidylyltransferase
MTRILTAAVLMPLIVWVALWSPIVVWVSVTALVAGLCFCEFRTIAAAHNSHFPLIPGVLAGLALLLAPPQLMIALPAALTCLALALAMRSIDLARALPNGAGLILGLIYIFGSWRCSLALGNLNRHWLLYAMALNWVGDIAAYFVGRAIGRHRLAPVVSPKKSWEGSIASVVLSSVFGVLYLGRFIPGVSPVEAVALSAAANIAGQLGDLSESALKRGADMKDSGTMLPGHGGWLDRVDSTLFALPLVLLWVSVRLLYS